MKEVWKEIHRGKSVYEVSSKSRVRRISADHHTHPGRLLKQRKHSGNRPSVWLSHGDNKHWGWLKESI